LLKNSNGSAELRRETREKEEEMEGKVKGRMVGLMLVAALMLLTAGSGAAQQVTYNFMPGVDFTTFHTYKWVEIPGGVHPNQIVDQEIKQAVNNVLAGKGFTIVTGDAKADLYVGYQCFIRQQRQWNAWGMGGGLRWGGGMGTATSSTIDNGTLAVDFYNPTSQELVWRGSAAQTLDPSGNQQKDMNKLNKAVAKLLKNFPPNQQKKSGW
jgi:uncharacterized protein DUF4136